MSLAFLTELAGVVGVFRCHKLFTFLSSSPEPLGHFQSNLANFKLKII